MDIDAVAVLVDAALLGSIAASARRLGITPMVASRRLAALEQELGVRLLHRTTRSLSLTPEGEAFLPYAQALVEGAIAARANLRAAKEGVSGTLRVNTSIAFGRKVITPIVPEILRANPDLHIDLELNDSVVDIVASGVDMAIRIAPLRDNSMIARPLGVSPRVLVASPDYLREYGSPRQAVDLKKHACLTLSGISRWPYRVNGRDRQVQVNSRFSASSTDALHDAAVLGAGITLLSRWNVIDDLRNGDLVKVDLDDAEPEDLMISAVYPTARLLLPKVRMFIAALETRLKALA
jgi:DNA-binding transcriptional LysR family regulator